MSRPANMPAMYRPWVNSTTVGVAIWTAQEEVKALAVECHEASRKMTFGWEPKAQAFLATAQALAAIATMRLQGAEDYAAQAEHEAFHVELWEPYKKVPTARWIRALNQVLVLRALCKHLRTHGNPNYQCGYAKLCEELEQAASELEQVQFPGMAGHDWCQSRPDRGLQPDPAQAQ